MINQSFDDNLIALRKFGTNVQSNKKSNPSRFRNKFKLKKKKSAKKKKFTHQRMKLTNLMTRFYRRINGLTKYQFLKMRNIIFNGLPKKSKLNKPQSRFRLIETRKQRGNKTIIIRRRVLVRSQEEIQTSRTIQKTLIDPSIQNQKSLYFSQSKPSIWDIPIDHENDKPKFFDIFNEIT